MTAMQLQSIADVLRHFGWLPDDVDFPAIGCPGMDLLPVIQNAWHNRPQPSRKHQAFLYWLQSARMRGAQLCIWPLHDDGAFDTASRLLWCPQGLKPVRRVAVLSSHLGRRADELREWFRLLRQIVEERSGDEQLVIASGTTASQWLECAVTEKNVAALFVVCPKREVRKEIGSQSVNCGMRRWIAELTGKSWPQSSTLHNIVHLSPSLPLGHDNFIQSPLIADRAQIHLADDVYVLRLLERGRLRRVLDEHLSANRRRPLVHLAIGERLVPPTLAQTLIEQGCRQWQHVAPAGPARRSYLQRQMPRTGGSFEASPWDDPMLTHWTRGVCGPWPDQTMQQFRHDLIFDHAAADHSALATLLRILATRRLCASTQTIRGAYPVVCFTAVPFDELAAHQVYRRHRGRWDFCPYGISISQTWLAARGARPVMYGDSQIWEQLEPAARPYFQLQTRQWRTEKEWRIVDDVDLSELPADQAWVFVPSANEARWASYLSRWPVRVLPSTRPALSRQSESVQ